MKFLIIFEYIIILKILYWNHINKKDVYIFGSYNIDNIALNYLKAHIFG